MAFGESEVGANLEKNPRRRMWLSSHDFFCSEKRRSQMRTYK